MSSTPGGGEHAGQAEFEEIRYAVEDRTATVTLHRPDRLNASAFTMARELFAAFDRADADDGVRAVIVTGEGRAFCAGADLGGGAAAFDGHRHRGRAAGGPR